jgi:DNA-binding XRE family transcriptional regulator
LPALRAKRIRRGKTQAELAEAASVERNTVTRVETGKPALVKTAAALASALECTVDDLRQAHQPWDADAVRGVERERQLCSD